MTVSSQLPDGVTLAGPLPEPFSEILTPDALRFLAELHRTVDGRRRALLAGRRARKLRLDAGEEPDFLTDTAAVRAGDWQVAAVPPDLEDRRVEITGPTDAKMVINALNSGARVFMADFEDANTPSWHNQIEGQRTLRDAVRRTLSFTAPSGKKYELGERPAVLMVRPRGLHLPERHLVIDDQPASGSLVDFGLFLFHNAHELIARRSGPYFYLPKLESHLEARFWNDVFLWSQDYLGLRRGTIRATVLIETILAAYEMDEILYELREHAAGLNAGRWDYIFSVIKKLGLRPGAILPDRSQVTMTVPFMRAYTELLVSTCHKRRAHAIGGMAAFIPSRSDAKVNEVAFARVREDKSRESSDGFDGTWVAHPDLVPIATQIFDGVLGDAPHQKHRLREDVRPAAAALRDFRIPGGTVTEAGLRSNISVGIQYLAAWLRGTGAVAIHNLMEDAATAEISRSQVWQWLHHPDVVMDGGRPVTQHLYRTLLDEEMAKIRAGAGAPGAAAAALDKAEAIFSHLVTSDDFPEFLTLIAYDQLEDAAGSA